MIKFRNEISNSEWVFGSLLITIMIWVYFLFPLSSISNEPLGLFHVDLDYWHYFILFPQNPKSLMAIITCHFFHINEHHLSVNLSSLIMLMIILAKISDRFITLILSMIVTSGSMIWLLHPTVNEHTNVLGASALIFSLASYIFLRICFNIDFHRSIQDRYSLKTSKLILINAWVSFVGGSLLLANREMILSGINIMELREGVSIHGHLYGFIAGIIIFLAELIYVSKIQRSPAN